MDSLCDRMPSCTQVNQTLNILAIKFTELLQLSLTLLITSFPAFIFVPTFPWVLLCNSLRMGSEQNKAY